MKWRYTYEIGNLVEITDKINLLGQEGWELVTIIQNSPKDYRAFLKRKKRI